MTCLDQLVNKPQRAACLSAFPSPEITGTHYLASLYMSARQLLLMWSCQTLYCSSLQPTLVTLHSHIRHVKANEVQASQSYAVRPHLLCKQTKTGDGDSFMGEGTSTKSNELILTL